MWLMARPNHEQRLLRNRNARHVPIQQHWKSKSNRRLWSPQSCLKLRKRCQLQHQNDEDGHRKHLQPKHQRLHRHGVERKLLNLKMLLKNTPKQSQNLNLHEQHEAEVAARHQQPRHPRRRQLTPSRRRNQLARQNHYHAKAREGQPPPQQQKKKPYPNHHASHDQRQHESSTSSLSPHHLRNSHYPNLTDL